MMYVWITNTKRKHVVFSISLRFRFNLIRSPFSFASDGKQRPIASYLEVPPESRVRRQYHRRWRWPCTELSPMFRTNGTATTFVLRFLRTPSMAWGAKSAHFRVLCCATSLRVERIGSIEYSNILTLMSLLPEQTLPPSSRLMSFLFRALLLFHLRYIRYRTMSIYGDPPLKQPF